MVDVDPKSIQIHRPNPLMVEPPPPPPPPPPSFPAILSMVDRRSIQIHRPPAPGYAPVWPAAGCLWIPMISVDGSPWLTLLPHSYTRVEVSELFNAKLCKICGECGNFFKISVNAVQLHN